MSDIITRTMEIAGHSDYYRIAYDERTVYQSYINYDCESGCEIVETNFDFHEVLKYRNESEDVFWECINNTRALDRWTDWTEDYFLDSVSEIVKTNLVDLTMDELVALVERKLIRVDDECEFLGQLIDVFEDFLEEKGIDIPNNEKEESEDTAILYGTDYGNISDELRNILVNWNVFERR